MDGRSRAILLSLIFICAILSGCLGEKESVEELDGDDILEWWIFRTKDESQDLDDDHVIEMNDEATGVDNLAHSWDIVAWWAVYAFLHMDQVPVPNEL